MFSRLSVIVARGRRFRPRLTFGLASELLAIGIVTAANAQELSATTERMADAVGVFIVLSLMWRKEGVCLLFGVILLLQVAAQGGAHFNWGEWAVRYPKDEASSEESDLKEGNSESSAESWWWEVEKVFLCEV